MTGPSSQQTGDEGHIAVQHALTKAGFVTGRLDPDLGEDLWVEVGGRQASAEGSFPLRALVQAKASRAIADNNFLYDVQLKHIRRWAAQPLPVFVVGADLVGERFFARSIDDILAIDLAGKDVMQLAGATVRVRLPLVDQLGSVLGDAILEHYRSSQIVLAELDQHAIEQDYFEILGREPPEPWASVPIASWTVMWKSPRRPQFLAAMLTELARQAANEYADAKERPAFVVFHVYRSLFDLNSNLATVRIDWVDPSHPKAPELIEILGAPGGFRLRTDTDVDAYREIFRARTATPNDFIQFGARVGSLLDDITAQLLARPLLNGWDSPLLARFDEVDELWNKGPGAPVECAQLDRLLTVYYDAVSESHFVPRYRRDAIPSSDLERLLGKALARMHQCLGSWRVFLRR